MIRDTHLRVIFAPILGIGLPLVAGIVSYSLYTTWELVLINLYFILTSIAIWAGSNWMHGKIRSFYALMLKPFSKIATMCLVEGLYGASLGGVAALLFQRFSREPVNWNGFIKFIILCVLAVIVFALVYEILFLSKEREMDSRKVKQLRRERSQAELQALTNEMDPHFIFNSLNTLNHLIVNNPDQAFKFNNKLAQVYMYFLINRVKDLITLNEELEFLNNYFFLLQIRHDNKLHLCTELTENDKQVKIPPCALQILLENAIKHNELTEANPLRIKIAMNGKYLKVTNNFKPKPYSVNSTGVGLSNLSSRYRILGQSDIIVEKGPDSFTVKLPMIK